MCTGGSICYKIETMWGVKFWDLKKYKDVEDLKLSTSPEKYISTFWGISNCKPQN
jgi:hypothetical protein